MKTNKNEAPKKEFPDGLIGSDSPELTADNPDLLKAYATNKMAPTTYDITGPDAEDIRSLNRGLTALRMTISECVILEDVYQKQLSAANDKIVDARKKSGESLADFTKKSAELQKVVETAFTKLGLDMKEGWKFDPDACKFFKG